MMNIDLAFGLIKIPILFILFILYPIYYMLVLALKYGFYLI